MHAPWVSVPAVSRRVALRLGALLAPLALTAARQPLATAQEGTPAATPAAGSADPQTLSLVQYVHPEKAYFWVPGMSKEAVLASLYDLDLAAYQALKADFAAAARGAAEELLAEPGFAEKVDNLPFAPESLVVAVGESDTDSLQSWFEILRHLLELRRPQDGIRLENMGISAQTTTQALSRFVQPLGQQPDWIICGLGGNDAVRTGPEPTITLVSIEETIRNLAEMRRLAELVTDAQWLWLTRPPIDEARMEAYEGFRMGPLPFVWRNADIDAINAWTREQPELVVDMQAAFGDPVPVDFQEPDGLHPTLAGHQAIAREFVEHLTA
jgi:acyl-CoA thioesterase I